MHTRTPFAVGACLVSLAACRSPFEPTPPDDDPRVGLGVHAWPLFEREPGAKETRTDVLWPVVSMRSDLAGSLVSAEVFYPIVHWLGTPQRSEFGVRPLFESDSAPPGENGVGGSYHFHGLLELLDWEDAPGERVRRAFIVDSRSSGGTDHFTVFPILWTKHASDEDRLTVFPFVWTKRGGGEEFTHVWPLYGEEHEGTRSKQWTLAPFFSVESDPANDESGWDAVWPLFHYDRSKHASHVRALPLLWHDFAADAERTIVFPLWWDFEDKESTFRMLFPVYGRQTRGDAFERTAYTPLWIETRDGAKRSTDVLWPLIARETSDDPDVWSWRVAPILFFGKDGERESHSHVFPLFGSWKKGDESGWYGPAGLVMGSEEAHSSEIGFVLNLARFQTADNGYETQIVPLFEVKRHGEHASGGLVLDLLASWKSGERTLKDKTKVPTSEGSLGAGLLARWEAEGEAKSEWSVLTPLVLRAESDDAAKTSEWGFLWRLVHSSSTEHKTTFAVNPLYRHETNDRGDEFWSVLFGLVAKKTEGGASSWRLLWFF